MRKIYSGRMVDFQRLLRWAHRRTLKQVSGYYVAAPIFIPRNSNFPRSAKRGIWYPHVISLFANESHVARLLGSRLKERQIVRRCNFLIFRDTWTWIRNTSDNWRNFLLGNAYGKFGWRLPTVDARGVGTLRTASSAHVSALKIEIFF